MKAQLLFAFIGTFVLNKSVQSFSPASFSLQNRRPIRSSACTTRTYASNDDASFSMASLQKRINQVAESDSMLPLVVLDSMLPRQVLKISVKNDLLLKLIKTKLEAEAPYFGMLGMTTNEKGELVHLATGVQVEIVGKPEVTEDGGLNLVLRGGKRFRMDPSTVENDPQGGWTQARVTYLDSSEEDKAETDIDSLTRAMQKAKEFTDPNVALNENKSLKDMWIELARERERTPGQIDRLLEDLGPMPSWEEPSECAFWIGALINPIPAMGVALEIRPRLLLSTTPEERTQIALNGIWNSIQHMQGPRIVKIKE